MSLAVTGQEGDPNPFLVADGYIVTRLAEWCPDINLFNIGQPFNMIEPAPPDYPDFCLWL